MFGRGGRGSASKSNFAHKHPAKAARKSPRSGRLRAGADTAQKSHGFEEAVDTSLPRREAATKWRLRGGSRAVGWVGRASIKKPAKQTPHQTSDWAPTNRPRCFACLPADRSAGWVGGGRYKQACEADTTQQAPERAHIQPTPRPCPTLQPAASSFILLRSRRKSMTDQ